MAWASGPEEGNAKAQADARAFARELVQGVEGHQDEIDTPH